MEKELSRLPSGSESLPPRVSSSDPVKTAVSAGSVESEEHSTMSNDSSCCSIVTIEFFIPVGIEEEVDGELSKTFPVLFFHVGHASVTPTLTVGEARKIFLRDL